MDTDEDALVAHEPEHSSQDNETRNAQGGDAWQAFRKLGQHAWKAGRSVVRAGRKGLAYVGGQADRDVRAMISEFPLFALSTAVPHRNDVPYTDDTERPVILIHGLGGSAGNFALLRAMLFVKGHTHVHCFDYRRHRSMQTVIPAFTAYVKTVSAAHPHAEGVTIIAHSMGGLIARHAAHDEDVLNAVHHLITLGTPHHGTHLARWGGAQYVRELRPDSPYIRDLYVEALRKRERTLLRITSFWTPRDVMVLPAQSSVLEGATNIEIAEATHLSWLSKPKLTRQIIAALDDDHGLLPQRNVKPMRAGETSSPTTI